MSGYFYKGQRLATKVTADKACSVFAGAEFVLGEMCEKTQLLLAVDRQNSIVKVRKSRCYSPYGFDRIASRESILGYNGEHRDVVSGYDLLGNGVRAYSSVLMRFCSADVISPFGAGGINAYGYCEGDPVNYLDTDGRMRKKVSAFKQGGGLSRRSHAIQRASMSPRLSTEENMVEAKINDNLAQAIPDKFWKAARELTASHQDFDHQSYAEAMVAAARAKGWGKMSHLPDSVVVSAISHNVKNGTASLREWPGLKDLKNLGYGSLKSVYKTLLQQRNKVVRTNIPAMPAATRKHT